MKHLLITFGPLQGQSLPAGTIKPCECKDIWGITEDGTNWGETGYAKCIGATA